jgi:hypothetical protein
MLNVGGYADFVSQRVDIFFFICVYLLFNTVDVH